MATPTNWIEEKGGGTAPNEDVVALYAVWDGKVLIHRRKVDDTDTTGSGKLSTPGGGFEAKDGTLGTTAIREALEEAGLTVDKSSLKVFKEPDATGRRFIYFYTEFAAKPSLAPNPSHIGEVDQTANFFTDKKVPGEDAGNFHWWAPIEPLITWLNDPTNAEFKADYVVAALARLKEKLAAGTTTSESTITVPNTITALSYNVSWEVMSGKAGWCTAGVDCAKNIKEYISKEGANKDFVGLQESSPIDQIKPLLPGFESVTHKSGFEDMILFYNKAKWKLDAADNTLSGEFVSSTAGSASGRPFIALFFQGEVCVINFHAGHNDDPTKSASDAFVNLSAAIDAALKTNKDAFINKLKTYNIIMMGDTNFPTITEKPTPYKITLATGVERPFYGLQKTPSCCLKGADSAGKPRVEKLDEAIDQILSTWTDTTTVVGPDILKKDYSDHLPVTATIRVNGLTTTTTTTTTNESTQTNNAPQQVTKGLRRNINSEARQQFDANTGPKSVNETIVPALNIFGDLYNLQKHDEMKAAPGTLTQFMTDYGINIDYGVPLIHLVKAFYAVFPDPTSGLPIAGFATSPAFHVICNYLQYRILTLNFEIQLKRRSSPFREKLLKRSEVLQAMLTEGKCGTVSQPSALDAFLKSMEAPASGSSDDCCNRLEAKMNFLLKMLQKSLGLNCDEIYAISEQIKATGSEVPDFDTLKSMFGRLGGGKVATPAPAPIDTEALAKRIVELLGSVKSGSADAAATIRTLTSDMKPNYKSIIESLIDSARGNDDNKLFTVYEATEVQALLTYFEHLQSDLAAFKEALNILSEVSESIDAKLRSPTMSKEDKDKLSTSKYKLKQDTEEVKSHLEQVAKMVNIVIEALKSYLPHLGPVERKKVEALLGPYLSVFLPSK
jgi:8-oxo-dGTP pyrophosphatase MutT (NUDIX family)